MSQNNITVGSTTSTKPVNEKVIVVQILVVIFLSVNYLLLLTFFKRNTFRTNARYIFFAHILLVDSLFLIMTNILLLLSYFMVTMPAGFCLIICIAASVLTFATPLTLTVMSLERYVAICMPLRHGELSTPRRAIHCILIIHSLSSIQTIIITSIFFASVTPDFYIQYKLCSAELLVVQTWQAHIRSAMGQFYFLVMCVIIVFTYVRIMTVAKEASAENKKSTSKGLRTVVLHGVQLILCLVQLWCPIFEDAILQIDLKLYINVRYFDYISFILAPRCLTPLVYGLRDEKFYHELRCVVRCGLKGKVTFGQ